MREREKIILFLWAVYLVVFVACAVIDLAISPGLSWAPWVWMGVGVGFAVTTVNIILNHTTCPKCGKMTKRGEYCSRCGRKMTRK